VELTMELHVAVNGKNGAPTHEAATLENLLERNEVRTQLVLNNPFFCMWRDRLTARDNERRIMLDCLGVLADPTRTRDPVLHATASWFQHQIFTLDDTAKAAVNLVLETVAYYLTLLAKPELDGGGMARYFGRTCGHTEHREVYMRVLESAQPQTYGRLYATLDASWDMADLLTTRIATVASENGRVELPAKGIGS
jgi:hypothetical protein